MEGIKVGEYYRTQKGYIHKIIKIYKEHLHNSEKYIKIRVEDDNYSFLLDKTAVVKHSKNIIDLIEVGDYVNGYKVRGKTNEKVVVDYYCYSEELAGGNWLTFYKDNIKSIVTKEQFEAMSYRLED